MKTNRIYSFLGTLIVLTFFCGNAWGALYEQLTPGTDALSDGDEILIAIEDRKAGTFTFIQSGSTKHLVQTVTDGKVTNPTAATVWIATASSTNWTFRKKGANNNGYLYNSDASSATLVTDNSSAATWTVSNGSNGTPAYKYFKINVSKGRYICWNGSTFGAYASSNWHVQGSGSNLAANDGALQIFRKVPCSVDPTVGNIMNDVSSISSTGATFSTSTGVSAGSAACDLSAVGFVYNTSSTPTLSNSVATITGYTSGALNKSVTGLTPNTTYYVRAYATNSHGTTYSDEKSFTTLQRYTISYDKNGGSGTIASAYKDHGVNYTLSDGTGFSKTGYTLSGWRLDNASSGTEYSKGGTYSTNAAGTFYAQWTINSHTLTWSFGTGGSSSETAGTHYTAGGTKDYGTAITYPSSNSMSRTGYTFSGWSTSATTMPDNDLTISASWTANEYTITYRDQGDKTFSGTQAGAPTTHTYGTATTLKMPTKTGYTFGGWFTASDCESGAVGNTSSASLAGNGYTANITLYAKWTANSYEVAFDKTTGSGSTMSNQSFTYDAAAKALSANTYTPAVGSHTYFAGWATSSERAAAGTVDYADKASVQNLTSTADGTFTLYAVWADHTYTNYRTTCVTRYSITLDKNSGDADGSAKVTENGTTLVKLKAPTKTGYTIEGYYTASSDGDLIADAEGKLEKSVTVSATAWTDEDGKWVKDAGATFYANWTANTYTITLDQNGATTDGTTSVDATYDSNILSASISNPSKTGYDFGGWYSGVGGTGILVINSSGTLQNSVTIETIGWTDASGYWILDGTATLYANWTAKTTTVSFDTNSGTGATSDKTATYDAAMPTPITVPTRSGYYFGGYYDGSGGTGTQYYTAAGASARSWDKENGSLTLYARWYGDLKAWCDPDVTVTGDVHLTSTKDVYVHSTSGAGNLISISSSDMGSATSIEVGYLDGNDDEVDKAESLFRLYASDASATVDEVDVSASRTFSSTNYSLRYTPSAYEVTNNYKLQLKLKYGDKVLKTVTHAIYGRSLPEKFVIAVKNTNDSKWYALPSNLASTKAAQGVIALNPALEIEVDNTETPTKATIAPSTRIHKAMGRATETNNMYGIRFTTTGSNKMQAASDVTYVWLASSNADNSQVWQLASSNLQSYTVTMPSIGSKKLGIFASSGDKFGYAATPHSYGVYFLPVETEIAELAATADDWTQHDVLVEANASSVSATKVLGVLGATTSDKETLADPVADDTYLLKLDGDMDYTNKNGQTLQFKWYDSSDKLKAYSWVTVPSIIAAGSNSSWSAFETAIEKSTTLNDIVVLSKPMTIDKVGKAKQIVIDQSGSNTGKLVINADQSLIVDGKISKFADGAFGGTSASDLAILSDEDGTGALITGEESTTTQAGVQFYTKARNEGGYVNQFIGVPLSSMTAYNGFYGTSLRVYDDTNDKWQVLGNNAAMYPFTAYNLMRKETSAGTLYMEGALNLPGVDGTKTLEMGSRVGDYLFANSWTAPIDVTALEESDFINADATIYIFNAGTSEDYKTNGKDYSTGNHDNPGQWLYMPVEAVKETPSDFSLTVIPSMQAFMVKSTAANATLTLNYDTHVYTPAKTSGATIVANRAPRREASEAKHEIIRVRVEGTSGYADDLLLFIGNDFSNGYDNGWEAYKVSGKAYTPQLYAVTEDGRKAISAQPDADNTVIGFKAGTEDDVYTFTLDYEGNDASLYLHDTYTDDYVRVEKDATYTFLTTDNTDHPRFVLTRFNAPQVTTGVDDLQWNGSKARKLMIDGILYIIRDGRIYNAEGALVK